jgi:Plasmid pRiA4b ORF-3-like protein
MAETTNAEATAAESALVRQVIDFVEWVGAGRKITATGALSLADARSLVDRLSTGDVIDPVIGDRVVRTKSSTELAGLSLIVEWAKAARLVRVVKGRLVPIRKAAGLLGRPARLWPVLLSTFEDLSPVFLPAGWGSSLLRGEFETAVNAILSALYHDAGPIYREQLHELAWDTVSARYVLDEATAVQLETARRLNDRDVDRVLYALARLGALTMTDTTAELTALARDATRRSRGEPAPGEPVHQVTVRLSGVAPPVWRRLLVPSATPLDRLHDIIQAAMGWENSHLHCFTDGKHTYGRPDPELGFLDESATRLGEVASERLGYTYDFGDDWEHDIVVEAVVEAEASGRYPRCLDGGGACPPEDCGGPPGYEDLRAALADPNPAEHADLLDWMGLDSAADFDPEAFAVEQADQRLRSLGRHR